MNNYRCSLFLAPSDLGLFSSGLPPIRCRVCAGRDLLQHVVVKYFLVPPPCPFDEARSLHQVLAVHTCTFTTPQAHMNTNAGIDTWADARTPRLDSHRHTWTHAPALKPHIHGHQSSTTGREQTEDKSHQPLEHVVFGFICQRVSTSQCQSGRSDSARREADTREARASRRCLSSPSSPQRLSLVTLAPTDSRNGSVLRRGNEKRGQARAEARTFDWQGQNPHALVIISIIGQLVVVR